MKRYDLMQRRWDDREERRAVELPRSIRDGRPVTVTIQKWDHKLNKAERKAEKRARVQEMRSRAAAAEAQQLRYKGDDSYGAF